MSANRNSEMVTGIYKITCIPNGKVYIGQSVDIKRRWKQHETGGTNKSLRKDLVRHGLTNFEFSVIEECDESNLNERELYWYEHYIGDGIKLYNKSRPTIDPPIISDGSWFAQWLDEQRQTPEYKRRQKWGNVEIFLSHAKETCDSSELPFVLRQRLADVISAIAEYLDNWEAE